MHIKLCILHTNMTEQIIKCIVIESISPHEFIEVTFQMGSSTAFHCLDIGLFGIPIWLYVLGMNSSDGINKM